MCVLMLMILVLSDFSAAYSSSQLLVKRNCSIVITCPFKIKSLPVFWFGPGKEKLTTYSVGTFISRNISAYSRIRLIGNLSNGEYNLNILNVSTDDVGTYQCQSVQNGTAVQSTFILNILEKPKTHSNIRFFKFQTKIGIPAKVAVRVQSLQEPTISWTQNVGGRLGAWTATERGSNTFLLRSTVFPTVMEHVGQYGIKVRNDAGSIDLTLKLLLTGPPRITDTGHWRADQNIWMTVDFYSVQESIKMHWFKNDNALAVSRRIRISLSSSIVKLNYRDKMIKEDGFKSKLYISNVSSNDITSYSCQVVNTYGSVEFTFRDHLLNNTFYQYAYERQSTEMYTTQQDIVDVKDAITNVGPPRITDTGHWRADQNIWMTVDFFSVQESIKIHWFKNDNALAVSRRIRISLSSSIVKLNYRDKMIKEDGFKSKLYISNVSSNDITSYSCQVVNTYGSVEFTFRDHLLNNTFYQYAYERQSTEMYTTQQDIVDVKDAITNVGIPLKFVLIGIGLVLIVITVAIALFWYYHQRNILEEYEGKENPRSNEQDPNEHTGPVHEYEDIESIPMNEVDDSNTEYNTTAERDTEQEQDIENPSETTSEAQNYQGIDESKFEMHTYTEYK